MCRGFTIIFVWYAVVLIIEFCVLLQKGIKSFVDLMLSSELLSAKVAEAVAAINLPAEPAGLYQPVAYTLESGGKRLRPQLVIASCCALGGDVDSAMNAALGIEVFHNFTLLHDDVMDRADLRRGRLTVHKRWDDNTAILSGDAMLTLATSLISRCDRTVMPEVLDLFNRTAMEVYEGQQMDMDFERRDDVTVDDYMAMIRLKTSVLIGCACRAGAIIARASEADARAFYDYGVNLGLAFQLRDDWLDTYGDPLVFGKEIGGDIVNGKKTWLLINALSESRDELSAVLADDLDPSERVKRVRAVYDSLRLDDRARKLISDYASRAVSSLDRVSLEAEARDYFVALAEKSVNRNY